MVWTLRDHSLDSFDFVGGTDQVGYATRHAELCAQRRNGQGYSYVVMWDADGEGQVVWDTLQGWDCDPENPNKLRRALRR